MSEVQSRRIYRHARTDALIGLALISSVIFIGLVAVPAVGPERLARHTDHLPILLAHIANGAVMLIAGAVALSHRPHPPLVPLA